MKYQVLFSLKNNEKTFKTVVCYSPDWRLEGLLNCSKKISKNSYLELELPCNQTVLLSGFVSHVNSRKRDLRNYFSLAAYDFLDSVFCESMLNWHETFNKNLVGTIQQKSLLSVSFSVCEFVKCCRKFKFIKMLAS